MGQIVAKESRQERLAARAALIDANYVKIRDNQDENKRLKAEVRALYVTPAPLTSNQMVCLELDRLNVKKRRLEREQKQNEKDIRDQLKMYKSEYK